MRYNADWTVTHEIYVKMNEEYQGIRQRNKKRTLDTRDAVYSSLPRIREIDDAVRDAHFALGELLLKDKNAFSREADGVKQRVHKLLKEKADLLVCNGYPPNVMEDVHTCAACKDTGMMGSKWCECRKRMYVKYMYADSGVNADKNHTFENFDFSLYDSSDDFPISPLDNIRSIYSDALMFAGGKGSARHFLYYGGVGLGKTYLSECVANSMMSRGVMVLYMSAPRLFSMCEEYRFNRAPPNTRQRIDRIYQSELLIIDDLGTEFRTSYTDSLLFDIINTRLLYDASLIISTNMNISQLKDSYSERITSRILGGFEMCHFIGADIRQKIKED